MKNLSNDIYETITYCKEADENFFDMFFFSEFRQLKLYYTIICQKHGVVLARRKCKLIEILPYKDFQYSKGPASASALKESSL